MMNYKKIVEGMIRRDSIEWLESLLTENGIGFKWVWDCGVDMEIQKQTDDIQYTVLCEVVMDSYSSKHFKVGGVVDDCGIYHSVVFDGEGKNVLWMSVKESREQFGITEFKVA